LAAHRTLRRGACNRQHAETGGAAQDADQRNHGFWIFVVMVQQR
jgi:hypothetical protein